ncbi:hypothetical protein QTA58_22790 [Neorhizobium sp. CSC1952]|uniref:hypothetical protein n=1 Tax=Neorhizobium sp. CSC1952 TaxID=2978974 RepID=UPI0025A5A645|nr:hypothetical protein [Rhizobium sp. CSC1952]WJR66982.1 hypothetical protein QTA58_22790 [Rhizobium sp. CSC1952]
MRRPRPFDYLSCALPRARSSAARLDFSQPLNQALVEVKPVDPKVSVPVAVGAYSDHVARAVGAAVGQTMHVVAFDVEAAVGAFKRSWTPAMLALPTGASQDVVSNVAAPSEDTALYRDAFGSWLCSLECSAAKLFNIDFRIRQNRFDVFDVDDDVSYAAQFENDCISHLVIAIWRAFVMVTLVDHFTIIAKPAGHRREQVDSFTVFPRIHNSSVARLHFHRPDLTLAKVLEDTIASPAIGITVLASFLAAYDENDGGVGGSDDAAALLPVVDAVDIRDAIVNLADVKGHAVLAEITPTLMGCGSFCNVKEAVE